MRNDACVLLATSLHRAPLRLLCWMAPATAAPPLSLFSPSTPPAACPRCYLVEPQPSLTRSLVATAPEAPLFGKIPAAQTRETPARTTRCEPLAAKQRQGSMGYGPATTRIEDATTPHAREATARPASQLCAVSKVHLLQRPQCFALDILSVVRGSPAPALCLPGPAHGVGSAMRKIHTRNCGAVECLSMHALHYTLVEDALEVPDRTRRPRVLIHFRVDPQATAANPVTAPLADERPCDQSPIPRLPSCCPPWPPIGAYAPTRPVDSSSVSGTASSASAPAPAPQAPCISAASYRISTSLSRRAPSGLV